MRQQNQRQSVENSAAGKTLNNCVNKRQKSESIADWHEVRISELCAARTDWQLNQMKSRLVREKINTHAWVESSACAEH